MMRTLLTESTPQFFHGCETCVFLGVFEGKDLYFCPQRGMPTVIARDGDDCGAYESWVWVCRQVTAGIAVLPVAGTEYLHRLHPDSYWGQRSEGKQDDMRRAMCAVNEVYAEAFA